MKNLFILGNPRSGTSLLRLMLNCHQDITVPPECGFVQWWSKKYRNWSKKNGLNRSDISRFVNDLKGSRKIETWNLNFFELEDLIIRTKPENYSFLCSLVIYQYGVQIGKDPRILGDKNNYYLGHLNLLEELFYDSYYIGIIRDGRDVACSYMEVNSLKDNSPYKPKLSNKIEEIAIEWNENNKNLWNFCYKIENRCRTMIRYEDLILKPKHTLLEMCKFLGVPFDSAMLEYYLQKNNTMLEPKATLGWKKKTRESLDTSKIGRYQNELSKDDVKVFNNLSRDTLESFNYL